MKKVTITIALLCVAALAQQKGTFTDSRDGKKYSTVKIGTQTWMAQNLNYTPVESATAQTATQTAKAAEGGYGIGVAQFSAPSSAFPDADINVSLQLKNVGTEDMPGGKKSIALIGSGGEIVEIIGNGSFNKMPIDFVDKKPVTIKCKIPATVKPGKYSLRIVIQKNGQTEWKVATDAVGNAPTAIEFTVNAKAGFMCYDNKPANCTKYGMLYDWETAKKVCPSGWHLPSDKEWDDLLIFTEPEPGTKLKAKTDWKVLKGYDKGNDKFNFSALPGGYADGRNPIRFDYASEKGFWWSASKYDARADHAYYWEMGYAKDVVERNYNSNQSFHSVRCIQD